MFIIFGICFLIISAHAQCCCDVSLTSAGACSGFCASSDGCFCNIGGANAGCRCGSPAGSACFPSNAACVSANCPPSNWFSVLIYSDNTCTNQVGVLSDSQTCTAGSLGGCFPSGSVFARSGCLATRSSTNGWPTVCKLSVYQCVFAYLYRSSFRAIYLWSICQPIRFRCTWHGLPSNLITGFV